MLATHRSNQRPGLGFPDGTGNLQDGWNCRLNLLLPILLVVLLLTGCATQQASTPTPSQPTNATIAADQPAGNAVIPAGEPAALQATAIPTAGAMQPRSTRPLPTVRRGRLLEAATAYTAAGMEAETLGTLSKDQLVIVSDEQGDRYRIVYGQSIRGYAWVDRAAVTFDLQQSSTTVLPPTSVEPPPASTPAPTASSGTVLADRLNVRSGPGTGAPVVGQLRGGDRVTILDRQDGWLQIRYATAPEGLAWVSTGYVAVAGEPTPVAPALPQLTGTLVFQERSGGTIYRINADGTDLQPLAFGLDPSLSPDGQRVAFTRWDEPRGLFVIGSGGGQEQRLIGENLIKGPSWSPDGQQIAFIQQRGGQEARTITIPSLGTFSLPADPYWRLGVVQVTDASPQRDDVPDQVHSFNPAWDRQGILYAGDGGLHVTSPGGSSRQILASNNLVRQPSRSPNGRTIVASMQFHDHWEVVQLNSDGTGLVRLTPNSSRQHSVSPTWSPDGRSIAFLTDRRGRWELWVMDAGGGRQRPLAPQALATIELRYEFAAEHVVDWGP